MGMSIQESAIKKEKQSLLTLVRAFSAASVHFWRGEWFVWTGTHYEQVAQQGIAQQAMAFLEQKSTSPVNGSMIRRFLDLLQIVRYADHPTAPCWLTTGRSPAPTELFAVNNGLLHVAATASGGPELLPHDPAFFRPIGGILRLLPNSRFSSLAEISGSTVGRCDGAGPIAARVVWLLSVAGYISAEDPGDQRAPEEWEKHHHPSPAGIAWKPQRRMSIHSVAKRSVWPLGTAR